LQEKPQHRARPNRRDGSYTSNATASVIANTKTLDRFVEAQAATYDAVVRELTTGRKRTHWMWFIFPQITGLGFSATAQFFAIQHREEARSYFKHPILGERLLECTNIILSLEGVSALELFGEIDAMKFKSSMTLFLSIAGGDSPFHKAIDKYFDAKPDLKTLEILATL
jgi:uncharacterized protein (DUF1810 family)